MKEMTAEVHYIDEDEYEQIELTELLVEKHLAVSKSRHPS